MSTTKIYLLPGFGENKDIFNEIMAYLPANCKVQALDYRPVLGIIPFKSFNGERFARALLRYYNIKPDALIIGHSMGGFHAYNIREIQGNSICLVDSYTDPNKVIRLTDSKILTYLVFYLGLYKLNVVKKTWLSKRAEKASYQVMKYVLDTMHNFYSRSDLAKLVKLSFEYPIAATHENPLRLHSKADKILRPPDEAYIEVPGDHFNLVTHHKEVGEIIGKWAAEQQLKITKP